MCRYEKTPEDPNGRFFREVLVFAPALGNASSPKGGLPFQGSSSTTCRSLDPTNILQLLQQNFENSTFFCFSEVKQALKVYAGTGRIPIVSNHSSLPLFHEAEKQLFVRHLLARFEVPESENGRSSLVDL